MKSAGLLTETLYHDSAGLLPETLYHDSAGLLPETLYHDWINSRTKLTSKLDENKHCVYLPCIQNFRIWPLFP